MGKTTEISDYVQTCLIRFAVRGLDVRFTLFQFKRTIGVMIRLSYNDSSNQALTRDYFANDIVHRDR